MARLSAVPWAVARAAPWAARWAASWAAAWAARLAAASAAGLAGASGRLSAAASELASAAALGLPVVFVVFVDRSLALIELKQRQRQMKNAGVDFGATDHAAVARAFGGHGTTVRDRDALRAAMQTALIADTFTLIACEIDRKAYDGRI